MKTIVLLASFSFSFSSSSSKTEQGSGIIKEETRNITDFNAISLAHNLQVQLSTGPFKVQIKGDDNILPFIESEISRGVLHLKYKDGRYFSSKNPVEVFIQAPTINALNLSGASSLTGNLVARDKLEIDTSGGSTVKLGKVDVKNLEIDSSGGSTVSLEHFDGKSLDIDSSGGCTVTLEKLNVRTITLDASGASNINLDGTSEKVDADISGGARLKANGLKTNDVDLDASGASQAELKSALAIRGSLVGGSSVHTAKAARVDVSRSTSARLIQE